MEKKWKDQRRARDIWIISKRKDLSLVEVGQWGLLQALSWSFGNIRKGTSKSTTYAFWVKERVRCVNKKIQNFSIETTILPMSSYDINKRRKHTFKSKKHAIEIWSMILTWVPTQCAEDDNKTQKDPHNFSLYRDGQVLAPSHWYPMPFVDKQLPAQQMGMVRQKKLSSAYVDSNQSMDTKVTLSVAYNIPLSNIMNFH